MAKITKADFAYAEKVLASAVKCSEVGVCFGMTFKATRVFSRLMEAAREREHLARAISPITELPPVDNMSVTASQIIDAARAVQRIYWEGR